MEWKDFNIDYAAIYPNGMAATDVERGSSSVPDVSAAGGSSFGSGYGQASKNPIAALAATDNDDNADDDNAPLMDNKNSSSSSSNGAGKGSSSAALVAPGGAPLGANLGEDKPAYIEGWVEKKGGGKMAAMHGGEWQKRYMRIDEQAGGVSYSKTSSAADKEKASGVIDLRSMREVGPYEKGGRQEFTRFNIDIGDKVFKFRVGSAQEGERWVTALQQWQDHFLLNM
jgi:hypothetical protein